MSEDETETDASSETLSREQDLSLKEREQSVAERELALKEKESKEARWWNPLVVAIAAAAIAAAGNAYVAWSNNNSQIALQIEKEKNDLAGDQQKARNEVSAEQQKADNDLILEVVKTSDPQRAADNLKFVEEAGIIADKSRREGIKKYLAQPRAFGAGVALSNGTTNTPQEPDVGMVYYEVGRDGHYTKDGPLMVLPVGKGLPDFRDIKEGTVLKAENQVNLRTPITRDFIRILDPGMCVKTLKNADPNDEQPHLASARSGGRLYVRVMPCAKGS